MADATQTHQYRGPIAWMARNGVAANLVMIILIVGGLMVSQRVKQEIFPDFALDIVNVSVVYRGASPSEVEQGVLLSIEDEVRGIDGVKEVTSTANEGRGTVSIELRTGVDANKILQDIKNSVDGIQSFPEEIEQPVVSLVETRNRVISVMVHGETDERTLRGLAERVRDELLQLEGITLVELPSARPLEIGIEIPQETLRRYGLTLDEVAMQVRRAAVEVPGGGVKTDGGEILLRVQERRDLASEFLDIPIVADSDGTRLRLGDIASVVDGFEDVDREVSFNGEPAIVIDVFRVGNETPIEVSQIVRDYVAEFQGEIPPSIAVSTFDDRSEIYRDRINLLVRNAFLGLVLVLLLLGLFLEPRLAFWVTLGIPISILGSFLFIPFTGASINMISLFAFIITLGIVVDDAVVVGENIYEKRQEGMDFLAAAIEGAREISMPVVFAVITNIVAFMPLFFVPGSSGNLFRQIPSITVMVFLISLVESLFVLPAHLAHGGKPGLLLRILGTPQRYFSRGLEWFTYHLFNRFVRYAVAYRYLTLSAALGLLILAVGLVAGGRITFSFLPKIDGDTVTVNAELPFGAPMDTSEEVKQRLVEAAYKTLEENGGGEISRGMLAQVGALAGGGGPDQGGGSGAGGSHLVSVKLLLVPTDQRPLSAVEFSNRWRDNLRDLPALESLVFDATLGRPSGAPINIQFSHRETAVSESAAQDLAEALADYAGVIDIDDGVSAGKVQLDFAIRPQGRALGLTAQDIGNQVRGAFFGVEALRQQRGRNEVRVMVRLPEDERERLHTVEEFILRTSSGGEIPLYEAASVTEGRSYTAINRREGRRVVALTADVEEDVTTANEVIADLETTVLPRIVADHPGVIYTYEGEQSDQAETFGALGVGFLLALMAIYALLAIPFRSYFQPLIVMLSIPFGIIGAVGGHFLLGYGLSLISMFGIIALSGVVVNDSMVLIVTANRLREAGRSAFEAITTASARRLRPILLTSLTTFFGLAPMIFETSIQARFLIPMAISIGFGIMFATLIILLLVPAVYMVLEDVGRVLAALVSHEEPKPEENETEAGALGRAAEA